MKELITAIASVLILMMFLMQFAANQTTYTKVMGAEHAVRNFRMENESEPDIAEQSVRNLRSQIASALACEEAEILVQVDRDGNYRVEAPVKGLIGPAAMLGISEDENRFLFTAEGSIGIKNEEPDNNTGTDPSDDDASGISDRTESEDMEQS